jgi:osmoprotectant transport system permease protein
VATATLGAEVAWGGVGRYIVDGIAQQDHVQLFAGAILVALLSFGTEVGLAAVQRRITPLGLRLAEQSARVLGPAPAIVVPGEVTSEHAAV